MTTPTTPCWIITLNPEKAAVKELLNDLAIQGVTAQTIPGIDGRNAMPALQNGERLAPHITRWRHLCELTHSEVGCYLAHLRALRRAFDEGQQRVCLLEDDIKLEPDFARVLAELEQLPDEIEMIRLMGLKNRKRKMIKLLSDAKHQLVRPERGWCGGQGYLINHRGMSKVLNHGSIIFEPIDKLFDHFWEYNLRVYGVEPHLIWENTGASTIIKSNVAKTRVSKWLYWLYPLGKLIRSINRHWYLLRHYRDFYPTEYPGFMTGKTSRIKARNRGTANSQSRPPLQPKSRNHDHN